VRDSIGCAAWVGVLAQQRVHAAQPRQKDKAAALQHQRVRDVVDVFRGAGKVHKLGRMRQRRHVLRAPLDEVFDCLDVVVGLGLDGLDLGARFDVELGHQPAQPRLGVARQARQFCQTQHRQVDQPLDFHAQPFAHEGVLGEHLAQLGSLAAVAAIQRRNCGQ
jgi:hypothetical protein